MQHMSRFVMFLSPDGTIGGSHSLLITLLGAPRRCDHDLPSHDVTNLGHALDAGRSPMSDRSGVLDKDLPVSER